MYSDFLGVKVTVAPLLSMVFSLKLGEWSCSTYSHIVGMEIGIDDQLTIIHKAGIINGWNDDDEITILVSMYKPKSSKMIIVEVLSIGTDKSEQTVQVRSDCSYKEQYEQCLHCLLFQLYLLDATIFFLILRQLS